MSSLSLSLLLTTSSIVMTSSLYSVRSAGQGPLCVFVHGLDSFSGTWKSTMESISAPCVAIDQRGCGLSEDLSDENFSQDVLVDDLYQIIMKEEPSQPVVLVGHSLGARVAMGYAAKYPQTLAALVIEDMDIKPRPMSSSPVPIPEGGTLFQRRATSRDALNEKLLHYGYSQDRIEEWWQQGRLEEREKDAYYWSNVNPDFRRLCYQYILSTENGRRDCKTIREAAPSLPCHVMVAGTEGTVCFEESIDEMKTILGDQLTIHRYPNADHSIHNSAKKEYLETMEDILKMASRSI